ncbi:hypothetical protein RYX36_023818, partial [Vicia faba]
TFTCINSLRRDSGVWLSQLQNLTDLTVSNVQVKASGLYVILGHMNYLKTLTLSHANLTGFLPAHIHSNLTHVDFSAFINCSAVLSKFNHLSLSTKTQSSPSNKTTPPMFSTILTNGVPSKSHLPHPKTLFPHFPIRSGIREIRDRINSVKTTQKLTEAMKLVAAAPSYRKPPLRRDSGVWLSQLQNLTDLTVSNVQVKASGPYVILGHMNYLKTLTLSHANLTGFLPAHIHSNLTHVDFSAFINCSAVLSKFNHLSLSTKTQSSPSNKTTPPMFSTILTNGVPSKSHLPHPKTRFPHFPIRSGIREIRDRINSVKTTQKLTEAMKLVAAAPSYRKPP